MSATIISAIRALGRLVLRALAALGKVVLFAGSTLTHIVRPPFYPREFFSALMNVGYLPNWPR